MIPTEEHIARLTEQGCTREEAIRAIESLRPPNPEDRLTDREGMAR